MKNRLILGCFCFAILFTSCHRDHLYYAGDERAVVRVHVDWSKSQPDPNGVSAYAFDHATGNITCPCVVSSNPNSIDVALPVGTYDLLFHNDTPEELNNLDFVADQNLSTFQALVISSSESKYNLLPSQSEAHYGSGCDVMATALVKDLVIHTEDVQYFYDKPLSGHYDIAKELTVTPMRITELIYIEVTVNNITSAAGAPRSLLTDMAQGKFVGQSTKTDGLISYEFVLNNRVVDPANHKRATISKQITSFGPPDATNGKANKLLIMNFVLIDGKTHPVTVDVNKEIKTSFDGMQYVHKIRVEISLPEAIGNGDGPFNPDVEEWQDVEIGLPV
ncbi:MAG: DUF5119 domain-containing protein [Alistipes sp.]